MQFGKLYRDSNGALVAVPNSDTGADLVERLCLSRPLFHGRAVPAILIQALLTEFGGQLHLATGVSRFKAASKRRMVPSAF